MMGRWMVEAPLLAAVLLLTAEARAQLQPCSIPRICAELAVESPDGTFARGDVAEIALRFQGAPDNGAPGGLDEIAALSLSISVPDLELADCTAPDANGLTGAMKLSPSIADDFLVFVENTSCVNRERCLCPGPGQTRDQFINLTISGPKDVLPPGQPITLPVIPNAELLRIEMRIGAAAPTSVPLHIFSPSDDPGTKPQFAAVLSLGDNQAVDRTADRKANVSNVRVIDGAIAVTSATTRTPSPSASATLPPTPTQTTERSPTATATARATASSTAEPSASSTPDESPSATPTLEDTPVDPTLTPTVPVPACPGDCNENGAVGIDELIVGVRIALGQDPLAACPNVDRGKDLAVTIDDLVAAVNAALSSCPP